MIKAWRCAGMLSVRGYALLRRSVFGASRRWALLLQNAASSWKALLRKKTVRRRSAVPLWLRTAIAAFSQKRQKITMLLCAVKYRLTSAY